MGKNYEFRNNYIIWGGQISLLRFRNTLGFSQIHMERGSSQSTWTVSKRQPK